MDIHTVTSVKQKAPMIAVSSSDILAPFRPKNQ